jgi:MFS family permease
MSLSFTDASPSRVQSVTIVLAAAIALACSALFVFSFGVFLKPLTGEFHWTRSQVAGALTGHLLLSMVTAPVAGWLADRWRPRVLIAASFIAFGGVFAALSLQTGSLPLLYAGYAVGSVLGLGTSAVVITRIVASWFDTRRGLALGLTLSGAGIGIALVPLAAQSLIGALGWRTAYTAMGLTVAVLGALMALFLRRAPARTERLIDRQGLSLAEARRSRPFWLLCLAFLFIGVSFTGVMLHLVPMLTDRGIDPVAAAGVQATIGLSLLLGRIATGFLLDRVWAPGLAAGCLGLAICGVMTLLNAQDPTTLAVGALLFGFGSGAEIDVLAFLVARYFGVRSYGQIYAWPYGCYMLGAAAGPLIAARLFETLQGYGAVLPILCVLLATAAVLLLAVRAVQVPTTQSP